MRFTRTATSTTSSGQLPVAIGGVFLPTRYPYFFLLAILLTCLMVLETRSFFRKEINTATKEHGVSSYYQEAKPVLRNPSAQDQCRFYLAESAVSPNSGMGMFTATSLLKGEMIGTPDICIFVSDPPKMWTHLRSHSYGWGMYFGQFEGYKSRAACEGFPTIFNTMPDPYVNSIVRSPVQQTTAGVRRHRDAAAGSLTQHYGMYSETLDVVSAGSELTIDYGDWEFDPNKTNYKRPRRRPEWLHENGWCIDNVEIMQSTIPDAGRGAFVKRNLVAGTTVAPAPLQVFKDRSVFQYTNPEQLYVNYCFQPKDSKMLFFPYGPTVNLINHSSQKPNVGLRWSKNPLHKKELLNMGYDKFWSTVNPGNLVLEVFALRDLMAGEELFLDYGPEWQSAWDDHVSKWAPAVEADSYVYPEDMDDTATLRTVKEQENDPYPSNLVTMCMTPDKYRKEGNHLEWREPNRRWNRALVFCHILDRQIGPDGNEEYTVSLYFARKRKPFDPVKFAYNASVPMEDLYIDTNVPRRAIRWIEKPYMDDEHLKNAFRHPQLLPEDLVSDAWKIGSPRNTTSS